jgi:hypothetical protein
MTYILLIVGALIFTVLGSVHGYVTIKDLSNPRAFTPSDAALREAMQKSSIRFHPDINLWRAWLGFNLTHSLGLIVFGVFYIYLATTQMAIYRESIILQFLAILVSACYLIVSKFYFFSKPVLGSAIALVSFTFAAIIA